MVKVAKKAIEYVKNGIKNRLSKKEYEMVSKGIKVDIEIVDIIKSALHELYETGRIEVKLIGSAASYIASYIINMQKQKEIEGYAICETEPIYCNGKWEKPYDDIDILILVKTNNWKEFDEIYKKATDAVIKAIEEKGGKIKRKWEKAGSAYAEFFDTALELEVEYKENKTEVDLCFNRIFGAY